MYLIESDLFQQTMGRVMEKQAPLWYSCFDSFIKISYTYILFKWRRILLDHHFNENDFCKIYFLLDFPQFL